MRHPLRTLLLVFGLATTLSVALLCGTPASAATSSLEWAMLSKVNATRTAYGLRALPMRADLNYFARKQSLAMATRHALFHSNLSVICCYTLIGENVGYGPTLTRVHLAFLASPSHRANILDRRWGGAGIGVASSGGYLWVTEIFRAPY
ncbi:MAG: hypothetical protein QOJ90_129 [Actinomycetota bacterium]|jgi:uncharacterized protein YkwD|nr:hypothetical protein [Actinomycetota bacterium]MDQ1640778.1 hypothetical protein [Actinomycetota bacterium]